MEENQYPQKNRDIWQKHKTFSSFKDLVFFLKKGWSDLA